MPARFLEQNVFEVAFLRERFFAPSFYQHVGGHFTHAVAQSHTHSLGKNEAARDFQIFTHAIRVNFQAGQHFREMMQSPANEADEFRQRFPFGLPAAEPALFFLHHGAQQSADKTWNALRRCQNDRTGDGVAFVRHRGRAAASLAGRLE